MMLERGWNQSELARASGLGRDSISTYVRGHTFPEPRNLRRLADALGTSPEQLLPNSMLSAIEADSPALEIRQAHGHLDKVYIRVNQLVTVDQAAEIFSILRRKETEHA